MKPHDYGPAFPVPIESERGQSRDFVGVTLRDYFAAAALTGLLAQPSSEETDSGNAVSPYLSAAYPIQQRGLARQAYEVADAMLAERQQESKE